MSRSRRNFSAEFKTNLVLQLLKGEKELNVLAVDNKREYRIDSDAYPDAFQYKITENKEISFLLAGIVK